MTTNGEMGYVGLGDMGGALARRIASRHPLRVYDRSEAAVAALVDAGAAASHSLVDLGRSCRVVLLCLPTSAHVRTVLFDDGGLAEALEPGSVVIDQTSGDPSQTAAMAAELATRGLHLVDAPVSGGAQGALAGTISMMLGAPAELVEPATRALRTIGDNVTHIGPVGSGHTMKLVNNLLSCSQRLLTLEALAIAAKQGIDPKLAVDVLRQGGARNAWLEIQGAKVVTGAIDLAQGFSLGLAHKDLSLACDLASEIGVPTFYGSLSRDLHRLAVAQLGGAISVEAVAGLVGGLAGAALVAPSPEPS
ncbi:MAG: NAD(P)-dependent oxidoreductase [Actinomycetota bacterium]|nr:NAD(P)-dependent oxidoreductase [Actinomycetota bacterium]